MAEENKVSMEEALKRLVVKPDYDAGERGPGPCVHTFRTLGGIALIGAHWYLEDLIKAMEKYGVENAGGRASALGHSLVLRDDKGPLFLEARPC